MNKQQLIKEISTDNKVSLFSVYYDTLKSKIKYGANLIDYQIFNFYNINTQKRRTYITSKINNKLIKKHNNTSIANNYKKITYSYKKHNHYIYTKWLELTGNNIVDFYNFITQTNPIIKKYEDLNKPSEELVTIDLKNYTKFYNEFVLSKYSIIEEPAKTEEIISLLIFQNHIISSVLETNKKEYAQINLETGIIDYPSINILNGKTNESILWHQIPKWPRIKRMAEKISSSINQLNYLEITIKMKNNNPNLDYVNPFPRYQIYQIPQSNKDEGLYSIIEKIEEEK